MMNDVGLLIARLTLGASIASHGAQKEFGWFEGPGPVPAAGMFEGLGFTPGTTYRSAAAWSEIGAGALIALGFGGPIGPAALITTMIVAQRAVHAKNGFFAQKNGIELGTIYGAAALALASGGYGAISIDKATGLEDDRSSWFTFLTLAGAVGAALAVLAQRTPPGTDNAGQHTSEEPAGAKPSLGDAAAAARNGK
jgi:putative oxidoreductase